MSDAHQTRVTQFQTPVPQTIVLVLDCTHVGCSGSVPRSLAHLTVRGCGSTQCSTPFGQNDNLDSPFRCLRVRLALSTSSQTSDPGDRHELVGTHTPLRRCPLLQLLSFICHVPDWPIPRASRLEKHFASTCLEMIISWRWWPKPHCCRHIMRKDTTQTSCPVNKRPLTRSYR